MSRLSRDAWALGLAELTARRGTCLRRQVGCVLLNARGHVLATGYNGRASGLPHCNEGEVRRSLGGVDVLTYPRACIGACAASGTQLDDCEAIHAEANALLQCREVASVDTAYVTVSPCVACAKLLLNTGCQRVVFRKAYAHDKKARDLWEGAGRAWVQLETTR